MSTLYLFYANIFISIPSGAIKRIFTFQFYFFILISIPSGAIKRMKDFVFSDYFPEFQFLLVRLRGLGEKRDEVDETHFNSSGAIKRINRQNSNTIEFRHFNSFWCD